MSKTSKTFKIQLFVHCSEKTLVGQNPLLLPPSFLSQIEKGLKFKDVNFILYYDIAKIIVTLLFAALEVKLWFFSNCKGVIFMHKLGSILFCFQWYHMQFVILNSYSTRENLIFINLEGGEWISGRTVKLLTFLTSQKWNTRQTRQALDKVQNICVTGRITLNFHKLRWNVTPITKTFTNFFKFILFTMFILVHPFTNEVVLLHPHPLHVKQFLL